jgi:hypothetical protein
MRKGQTAVWKLESVGARDIGLRGKEGIDS